MMHQVNKLFFKQNLAKQFYRNLSREKPITTALYPLQNRSLLKVSGNEAPIFLQGLITNDMQHFEEGANSMYAMFLNNRGRVLYDTLIHKWEGNDSFLVECDKDVSVSLQKHLKMFKLKRNVQIENINENYRLCALIIPSQVETDTTINPNKNINVYKDPRLSDLGYRVIVSSKAVDKELENITSEKFVVANDDSGYKYLRYKLGVGEGSEELPIGATFPLEANCDYLHGVSFHKGCYIGQELTARVHHTGVVRKRIMPIKFNNIVEEELERDEVISGDEKKSNYGKLKAWINDYGLGIVRTKEALEAKSLRIGKLSVEVVKPSWWPIEAPKEKATVKIQE